MEVEDLERRQQGASQQLDARISVRLYSTREAPCCRKVVGWRLAVAKESGRLAYGLLDSSVQTFRSRLRMAACVYYGQATAVVVFPVGGDDHTMALLHWGEDQSEVIVDEERMRRNAREAETGDECGVDILSELMSRGSGVVAASPAFYRELSKDQTAEVQKIVLRGLEATGVPQVLGDDPPGHGLSAIDDTAAGRDDTTTRSTGPIACK